MKKHILLFFFCAFIIGSASTMSIPQMFKRTDNNIIAGGISGALTAGLGSMAQKYHRRYRSLDREISLALIGKMYAKNETDLENTDIYLQSLIRRKNEAHRMMLYFLIPASLVGATSLGFLGHGSYRYMQK